MNDSKAVKNWLIVRNISALLIAIMLSVSFALGSNALTAYAATYASEYDESMLDKMPVVGDEGTYDYWLVFKDGLCNQIFLCFTKNPMSFSDEGILATNVLNAYHDWRYDLDTNTWVRNNSANGSNNFIVDSWGEWAIFASNYDIYQGDTLVFPPPSPLVTVMETVNSAGMTMNPLAQILGLLPLLIPCLAGLVGFSKGWRFLSGLLRKA